MHPGMRKPEYLDVMLNKHGHAETDLKYESTSQRGHGTRHPACSLEFRRSVC